MDREVIVSSRRSRLQHVPGLTLLLAVTGTLGRVITLITQTIIARELGLSMLSDAYFATEKVPELLISFVAAGFSATFIPMFAQYRISQGDDEAWKFASSFLLLSLLVSLLFTLVTVLCASPLVSVIAPGFQGAGREIAVSLLRIMALSTMFLGLNAGLMGLLQSHGEFIVPEVGRIAYNCVLLGAAWTLSRGLRVSVLAWGTVLAAIIWLVIQIVGVVKQGALRLVWVFDHPGIRRAVKQLLPYVIAISGVEITLMLDRMVASGLAAGSIAALNYASRIILLPVGLFAIPLRTAFYPTLSKLAARREMGELAETTLSGLRMLFFIVIPAAVGLAALRVPVTRLLFERGAFDSLATQQTSEALICYALGVPAVSAIFFLTSVYLSLGDPFMPVKLHVVNWSVNLLLNLLLSRHWGYQGVAIATAVSTNATAVLLLLFLKRHQLRSLAMKSLLFSLSKTLLVSVLMGSLLLFLPGRLNTLLAHLRLDLQSLQVAILVLVGALTYLVTASLLGADELITLRGTLRSFLKVRGS
jgi:putative peptidoglycan lipid II flippase